MVPKAIDMCGNNSKWSSFNWVYFPPVMWCAWRTASHSDQWPVPLYLIPAIPPTCPSHAPRARPPSPQAHCEEGGVRVCGPWTNQCWSRLQSQGEFTCHHTQNWQRYVFLGMWSTMIWSGDRILKSKFGCRYTSWQHMVYIVANYGYIARMLYSE